MNANRMLRWYNVLLHLFPQHFRQEFGQEMLDTFAMRLEEAQLQSRALLYLWLDELVRLPGVLLQVYFSPQMPKREALTSVPLSQPWHELLLALTVFLLPAGMLFSSQPDLSLQRTDGVKEALLFLGIMLSMGWIGGFPLWSRPYIGLILTVSVYLYVFQLIASQISPTLISNIAPGPWDRSTYLVLKVASNGILWLMLFCLTLLAVALLAVFNRFQPLLARLHYDWSLLSYILYGESVFALMLFQSRESELGYILASLLCLTAGIWFFLKASRPKCASPGRRLLTLLVCLTLAVGISALQGWDTQSEGSQKLLLVWGWLVTAVLLPGFLARLFARGSTMPAARR